MESELENYRDNGLIYLISPETCNYCWFNEETNEIVPFSLDNFEFDAD